MICTICSLTAAAHDFQVDGIYYNIINQSEVEVTSGDDKYSGEITIPSSVTYGDTTYQVTAIGEKAFYQCADESYNQGFGDIFNFMA